MFSAHAHMFERMYIRVARVNACKRVHTLPAAFSLSQHSLILVFCGFLRGYNGEKD